MATCDICQRNMSEGISCSFDPLIIEGRPFEPIRCGDETGGMFPFVPCGDCRVERGGVHHHGCDLEQCPACMGQLFSCGCMNDDPFEDDDDDEDLFGEDLFGEDLFGDGLFSDGEEEGEGDPDYSYAGRKRTICDFVEPPRKCGSHGRRKRRPS
jgi:hypothetical protein